MNLNKRVTENFKEYIEKFVSGYERLVIQMTLEILELKDLAENIDNKIKEDTKMRRTLKQDISKHFQ